MADIVIFGTGEIAELAQFYFTHDTDHRVAAFTVDGTHLTDDRFGGAPVVAFEDLAVHFPARDHDGFVALGYSNGNRLRTDKCAAMRATGYRLASYVSSHATIFADFQAGDNCFILEDNTIQPRVRIGNNVTLWSGNHIGHHAIIEDNVFISSHVVVAGGVTVGDSAFLGINSTIRDHVRLGRNCVIGAGAQIDGDTEDGSVYTAPKAVRSPVPSHRLRHL
jgi:sugar O-acyltransferase (sialic acid O-acetyltransferase NeuD family)